MKLRNPVPFVNHPPGAPTPTPPAAPPGEQVLVDSYTGIGEVLGVHAVGELLSKAGHAYRIKRSLLLNWDDLKAENVVVLGSSGQNVFLRDLPQEQHFVYGPHEGVKGIVNLKPRAGEEEFYAPKREGPSSTQIVEDYALISVLKGLDGKHRLIVLAGVTTFGTQAAAEYLTRPESVRELAARLSAAPGAPAHALPDSYQVLLKVKITGGVPVQTSYLTHHTLP
jgi:hypothetical protein